VAVAAAGVSVSWQNVEAVTLSYIPMDVEVLFSRSPFASQAGRRPAFTRRAASQTLRLPAGKTRVTVPVPDEVLRKNMLVEVSTAGKTVVAPYFAGEMDVRMTENYGQLRVTESAGGKALSKVYVRLSDVSVKFHDDGYTVFRGRFDCGSVNTPNRQPVERFAVLVLGDGRGAATREAAPPQQ
jgi:hypothetical protein